MGGCPLNTAQKQALRPAGPGTGKNLADVCLDRHWPLLPLECLAFSELKQDEFFPRLAPEAVPLLIDQAIHFGRRTAQLHAGDIKLHELLNKLLKQGVTVRFLERSAESWVRAQYLRKPPAILVSRASLAQLDRFFRNMNQPVAEDELIRMHLFHEWFHHLEETKIGRADTAVPKAKIRQWGPIVIRRPIRRAREIAAHAFVQEVMKLPFSPLLIDQLIHLTEKGWDKTMIREHFQEMRKSAEEWLSLLENRSEAEKDNGQKE
jgi:hypothetical protein